MVLWELSLPLCVGHILHLIMFFGQWFLEFIILFRHIKFSMIDIVLRVSI
jgi:hypothetical protein